MSARPAEAATPEGTVDRGWKAVALPTEHGGWGLTLEPALLGLLIAPSGAGVALAGVALLGFLVRTPLKVVLVDRRRHRLLPRTAMAGRVAVVELAALLGLLVVAALTADGPFWVPLALALPLIGVELWYDMRSRSRRLVPELAGAIGIGSVAAAIVLADGEAGLVAVGAWLVIAARVVAAIPFVRTQLRRAKHQAHRLAASNAAQGVALAVAGAGWWVGAVPGVAVLAIAGLGVFHLVAVRRPPPTAPILGAQQVVLGLTVVLVSGLGFLLP